MLGTKRLYGYATGMFSVMSLINILPIFCENFSK